MSVVAFFQNLLDSIKGHVADDREIRDSEHHRVCHVCGQTVDERDLGQVVWHEAPTHGPKLD